MHNPSPPLPNAGRNFGCSGKDVPSTARGRQHSGRSWVSATAQKLTDASALAAVIALAVALRAVFWRDVFVAGAVRFLETDPYIHFHRVLLALDTLPRFPLTDSWIAFPKTFVHVTPPLFDLAAALLVKLLSLVKDDPQTPAYTMAWIAPSAGVAGILLLYFWTKAFFGKGRALLAALLLAILPLAALYSMIGRPDHHCVEIPFSLCILWSLSCAAAQTSREKSHQCSWLAGMLLALGQETWTASTLLLINACVFLSADILLEGQTPRYSSAAWNRCIRVFAGFVAVFIPFALWHWPTAQQRFDPDLPSLFPLLILAVAFLTCGTAHFCLAKRLPWAWTLSASLLAGAAAFVLFPFSSPIQALRSYPFYFFDEFKSSLMVAEHWGLSYAHDRYTWLFSLIPFLSVVAFKKRPNPFSLLLMCWTVFTFAAMAQYRRYGILFCPVAALWIGRFAASAAKRLVGLTVVEPQGPLKKPLQAAASLMILLTLSAPVFGWWEHVRRTRIVLPEDYYSAFRYIRAIPSESSLEYGVLAPPEFGPHILALARKPIYVWNAHTLTDQIENTAAFYLSADEGEALKWLRDNKLRYVLVNDLLSTGQFETMALTLGKDPSSYWTWTEESGRRVRLPTRRLISTLFFRLYYRDGEAIQYGGTHVEALRHFKLVFPSPLRATIGGMPSNEVKVFQAVYDREIPK